MKSILSISAGLFVIGTLLMAQQKGKRDYLTIDEAVSIHMLPGSVAPVNQNLGTSPALPEFFRAPYKAIEPVKLFDNCFFVGTSAVGSFVVNTGEGLIMFDTGCGDADAAIMIEGMRKLGLDPSKIKLIFVSHEHFDHYGGVQYLKKNVCPDAKVAMSLVGWNLLQTIPLEGAYIGTRPQKIDIFLTDGMKIKLGTTIVRVIATPGHSAGCMSFIVPVTDNNQPHMVGIMGGSAVFPTHLETMLYKSSIEYFKAFAVEAKCDAGLFFHWQDSDLTGVRNRKSNETNPLIIGTEKFDSEYLQSFRNRYQAMLSSGQIKN